MKNVFAILALAALSLVPLSGQVILTPTTLSVDSTTAQQSIVVASATPNASTADNFAVGTAVVIDNSLGFVTSVSSTRIGVNWANSSGSVNVPHKTGALVWSARANFLTSKTSVPTGSCTRTQLQVLPVINVSSTIGVGGGTASDCLGGRWVTGDRTQFPPTVVLAPDPGGTLYTGINTNGTAVGATTLYCSEFNVKTSMLATGMEVLNGTTVTGNARYVILYDSTGNRLVNSALAGQASVTASVYEQYPFVNTAATPVAGKFYVVGPARYFGCIQDNAVGSTTVRMAVTGQADQLLTKGQTGATFGTVPTLTVPTTFTTAVGPLVGLYQ